ncbi:MAG: DUF4386 domain-containing protein [Ignavibacteriaceae bacterium]|jgi:hypothetical protein|nr:DUF4386 domain-containing protein [Ignavibacteriaceae bacterium]
MTETITNISIRKAAIVSGVSILIMTIAAVSATDITIGSLIVPDNAAATVKNIKTSLMQFRIGIFSLLITLVCDVLAAWGLYLFLKPVNKDLSLLMAWLRLVYVALLGTAILNYIKVLLLISGDNYVLGFGVGQFQSQVMLLVNEFDDMWSIGLFVFGLHIFLLGYLSYKSGYIPKTFGILLIIAFAGYTITTLGNLLLPDYNNYKTVLGLIFILPMLSEVALGLWLLIKGGKLSSAI